MWTSTRSWCARLLKRLPKWWRARPGLEQASLVVVGGEFDPARIWAPTRGLRVRAVHADPRSRVYVQLAVDHQRVSRVSRHRWREGRVVIDLEPVSRGIFDLESLVPSRLHRLAEDRRIECDFRAVGAVDDVLVKTCVIGSLASSARQQSERNRHCYAGPPHLANNSSSAMRPSSS